MNMDDLKKLIAELETLSPEHAAKFKAELERLEGLVNSGEASGVKVRIDLKLEKFEGEYSPDKTPFEVIQNMEEGRL